LANIIYWRLGSELNLSCAAGSLTRLETLSRGVGRSQGAVAEAGSLAAALQCKAALTAVQLRDVTMWCSYSGRMPVRGLAAFGQGDGSSAGGLETCQQRS